MSLDSIRNKFINKFGQGSAEFASYKRPTRVVPSGVLDLDFALETGGWTLGDLHVLYGPPDIGKSSSLGLAAIKNAQKMGLNCAIVAVEPQFSAEWAILNGVDVDNLLIVRPATGEEAFEMLLDLVSSGEMDFVLFDSLGAVVAASEMESDGKSKVGGQSSLISRGVKAAALSAYRNDCGVLFINQIRDNMKSPVPGAVDMPGGHTAKHLTITRVRMRPGPNKFSAKVNGDDVTIGREIVCIIERNKQGKGTNRKAIFTYWQMDEKGHEIGIDSFSDIINTAIKTGVIEQGGAYFKLPSVSKKIKSRDAVVAHLAKHPEQIDEIRDLVLTKVKK